MPNSSACPTTSAGPTRTGPAPRPPTERWTGLVDRPAGASVSSRPTRVARPSRPASRSTGQAPPSSPCSSTGRPCAGPSSARSVRAVASAACVSVTSARTRSTFGPSGEPRTVAARPYPTRYRPPRRHPGRSGRRRSPRHPARASSPRRGRAAPSSPGPGRAGPRGPVPPRRRWSLRPGPPPAHGSPQGRRDHPRRQTVPPARGLGVDMDVRGARRDGLGRRLAPWTGR